MSDSIHLASYLFTRLRQLGVESVHGVPGDFNLGLLDYVEPSGLHWVGNCNELNAGYAADGYARIKGLGALVTTFGVGELSAINAIAGAFAERAPVVHIVGTPTRAFQDSRRPVHHTFNDGDHRRFVSMHNPITVAQAHLRDPSDSPAKIDAVLQQCLLHSRPVYIEIPLDMISLPVPIALLDTPITLPPVVEPPSFLKAITVLLERMAQSKQPVILVDGESRAFGILDEIATFVSTTNWPTWTTAFGKGLLDETSPCYHGVYMGADKPHQKSFIDSSDLVVVFGPHFSTTNSYQLSAVPNSSVSVLFTGNAVHVGSDTFEDLPPRYFLGKLLDALKKDVPLHIYDPYPELETPTGLVKALAPAADDQPVTQKDFYLRLSEFLQPGDLLLAETGTAAYGAREMPLPAQSRFFGPATWLSIGYMLPSAQGAALARRELLKQRSGLVNGTGSSQGRTILLIGDGSLQLTVQELSTIIRENLNLICFVINNDGYTIERCIHGANQKYNDVFMWRYLEAPSFFGAQANQDGKRNTFTIRTWGDLQKVVQDENLSNGAGLRMVEVHMPRDDAPKGLLKLLHAQLQKQEETKAGGA